MAELLMLVTTIQHELSWHLQTVLCYSNEQNAAVKLQHIDFVLEIQVVVLQVKINRRIWRPESEAEYS